MKTITVISVLLLTFTAIGLYKACSKAPTYSNRLSQIADRVNNRNTSWTAETPQRFAGYNIKEFKGIFSQKNPGSTLQEKKITNFEAPDVFDSRQAWPKCNSIGEVHDQANCASDYAVNAASVANDRICIESGEVTTNVRLSAADIITCCEFCGNGCQSGNADYTWFYLKIDGLVTGGDTGDSSTCKPYFLNKCAHHSKTSIYAPCGTIAKAPACSKKCQSSYKTSYESDKHHCENVYKVTKEDGYMAEISQKGPVQVFFEVYEDFLTYRRGVYQHYEGGFLGFHTAKIIGYGEEEGQKYWLCSNTWNETWGDKGLFKILRGVNHCAIEVGANAGDTCK